MKKLPLDAFLALRRLVRRSARPLDYTKWEFLFENGSCDAFLSVLSSYQNEDGGFGFNIECNNWNPNSAPYTVCIALDELDAAGDSGSKIKEEIIAGILRYLESGAHMLEEGWVGMQGIPSNNDYAHMPWFHFDSTKATYADIGVTKRLADFICAHADAGSGLYRTGERLKERYSRCGQVLLHGYPDYDPSALNIQAYDPAVYPAWLPLPVYFIGSPESSLYPACRRTVDMNLDTIVGSLLGMRGIPLLSAEETDAYEQSNPHPDGKRWCVPEQTVAHFFWGSHFIIRDLDILRKFGRWDFDWPAREP